MLIVSELFDTNDDKIKSEAWFLTHQIDTRIEPYTVDLKRFFNDDVLPLLEIVCREGIEIQT